jgi:hypothetical protein
LGYETHGLTPIFEKAIDEATELAAENFEKDQMYRSPAVTISHLHSIAYTYVHGVLAQDRKFATLRDSIKSYGSVFVVGAGLSFESGMPLSVHLKSLLNFCKVSNYDELLEEPSKCYRFKMEFEKICNNKSVGKSHSLIVKNFPDTIKEILCLNWDNLIEKAARKIGKTIPKISDNMDEPVAKGHLWKFHGDVERITMENERGNGGWVFPSESGYVFDSFERYIRKQDGLGESIFTLVIVGYSESDTNIKELLTSLEQVPPRPTFRITTQLRYLHEPNYLVGPSDFVLQRIFESAH